MSEGVIDYTGLTLAILVHLGGAECHAA
jgi:hypothetical protein